jgi:transposase-like protein
MDMNIKHPKTLLEAVKYFAAPEIARDFMVKMVWPDGVTCPKCGGKNHGYLKTRNLWKCRDCAKQFSLKAGTVMEDSPLPLDKWLLAVWALANCKNGISSYELARDIGVTQKSAWFLLHRVRLAMKEGSFRKMRGTVEADEKYVGGRLLNMHKSKLKALRAERKKPGKPSSLSGTWSKTIVMGLLERGKNGGPSQVRTTMIEKARRPHIQDTVRQNVEAGSELMTDALASYKGLKDDYIHEAINHAVAYARGNVHTNGLENFWSLLARTIMGTYVACEPFHLEAYLDEQCFRFNNRKGTDADRFVRVLQSISGKRLTYRELIGETGVVASSAGDGVAASV